MVLLSDNGVSPPSAVAAEGMMIGLKMLSPVMMIREAVVAEGLPVEAPSSDPGMMEVAAAATAISSIAAAGNNVMPMTL